MTVYEALSITLTLLLVVIGIITIVLVTFQTGRGSSRGPN